MVRRATVMGDQCTLLTFGTCLDHNIMFSPYFAADEAQTLDAIYGGDGNAIAGASPFTVNREFRG